MFDNVNLTNILWTMVNLLVLFLLLKKFLFAPVTRVMEARTKAIADAMGAAEEKNRAAEARAAEYDAHLEDASRQAAAIVAEAQTRAQRAYDDTIRSAEAEGRRLLANAQAQMERDREAMLSGVRAHMAELVLLAAARLSEQRMDADADRALVEEFLDEVGARHE